MGGISQSALDHPSVSRQLPRPTGAAGGRALLAMLGGGGLLAGLQSLHRSLGDIFELPLGRFSPIVVAGPEASHFVLVQAREKLLWRPAQDPVTKLLRRGLLVLDGDEHRQMRRKLSPPLSKSRLPDYAGTMTGLTDWLIDSWPRHGQLDLLQEMRSLALAILMDTLYGVDVKQDTDGWLPPLQKLLRYISPGLWLLAPWLPRPGYASAIAEIDGRLQQLIEARRRHDDPGQDLVGVLLRHGDLGDDLIRDQLLTMLIAGHDTTTAHLAWTLYLIAGHPAVAERLRDELGRVLHGEAPTPENVGGLQLLDNVIKESLRLYPPIHIGNRIAAETLSFKGYRIPAGRRLVYSIYLTQRDAAQWPNPHVFDPDRFEAPAADRAHYAYLPFGGGRRTCIGMAFAELESRLVLARLLQRVRFQPPSQPVHAHMGATLEPAPAVLVEVDPA